MSEDALSGKPEDERSRQVAAKAAAAARRNDEVICLRVHWRKRAIPLHTKRRRRDQS
jgi:hypothetical protein